MKLQLHRFFLSIVLLLCLHSARGVNNYWGGKLEYTFRSGDSLELFFTLYAKCNGALPQAEYAVPQRLYISRSAAWHMDSIDLPLCNYRVSTDICPDTLSSCFGNGVLHTSVTYEYRKTIYLPQYDSCRLVFQWEGNNSLGHVFYRDPTITTSSNIYTRAHLYAYLDNCDVPGPNSPVFTQKFPDYIKLNKDLVFSYGIATADPVSDSIHFNFIYPLTSSVLSGPSYYALQWSNLRPITFLGYPNIGFPFPSGFHIDNKCASVAFRPVKINEVTVFAVSAKKYVKYNGLRYLVSEVMYEHIVNVIHDTVYKNYFPPQQITSGTCIGKTPDNRKTKCNLLGDSLKTICLNGSTFLSVESNPSYSYIWKLNDSVITGANSYRYLATDTGRYIVTITNTLTGCKITTDTLRVVGKAPRITGGDQKYCVGDTAHIEREQAGYTWMEWKKDGQGFFSDTPQVLNVTEDGFYMLEAITKEGCRVYSNFIQVKFNQPDTTGLFARHRRDYCGDFTDTLRPTKPLTQYSWQGQAVSADSMLVITLPGTYLLGGIDTNHCPITDSVTVYKHAYPQVNLGADTGICFNDTLHRTLYATDTLVSGYKYRWNNRPTDTLHTYTPANTGTYFVTVTSAYQCKSADSITIAKYRPITVYAGTDTSFCYGTAINRLLTATPAAAGYRYVWNNSPTDTLNTYLATDTGLHTVLVTDNNGCKIADSVMITRFGQFSIQLGNDTGYCYPHPVNKVLSAVLKGTGYRYVWNNNPADTLSTYTANAAGQYFVTVTDTNRCTAADSIVLLAYPKIDAGLGADTAFCHTDTINLLLTASANTAAGYTYRWNGNATDTLATYTATDTGMFVVEVVDTNGCRMADTLYISRYPEIVLNLGADTAFCHTANLSYPLTAPIVAGYRYRWNANGADTLPAYTVTVPGWHFVEITASGQCKNTDSIKIEMYPRLSVTLGNDTLVCDETSYILQAPKGFKEYQWSAGGMMGADFITVNNNGMYWVLVKDTNNCTARDTVNISFGQSPSVSLEDTVLCETPMILFEAPAGLSTYLWSTGSTAYSTEIRDTGLVWLRVANACGQSSDTARVDTCTISPVVYIPNAFTPNGVGPNDIFTIYTENVDWLEMNIYNRWGELIYKTNHLNVNWDGRYKGEIIPQDVYMYIVQVRGRNGKLYTNHGTITVVR